MNLDQEHRERLEAPADSAALVAATDMTKVGSGVQVVTDGRFCYRCGYALTGLPVDGACPECATDVALSLREPWLSNTSNEYLKTIKRGLSFVLNGILLQIVFFILTAISSVAFAFGAVALVPLFALSQLGISILILAGYWLYTQPDPGQMAFEASDSARKIVRWVVAIQAATSLAGFLLLAVAGFMHGPIADMLDVIEGILYLIGSAVWLLQFFAVMRYTRWLAARVPDKKMIRHTRLYMWLLPVIAIVGAIALMLGPLIALILYWNLLHRLRLHLKRIIRQQDEALAQLDAPAPTP